MGVEGCVEIGCRCLVAKSVSKSRRCAPILRESPFAEITHGTASDFICQRGK